MNPVTVTVNHCTSIVSVSEKHPAKLCNWQKTNFSVIFSNNFSITSGEYLIGIMINTHQNSLLSENQLIRILGYRLQPISVCHTAHVTPTHGGFHFLKP